MCHHTKFRCKRISTPEDTLESHTVIWPWTQHTNHFERHSGSWWCITIPNLVVKSSVIQKTLSSHLSLNHEGCWGTIDDFATSLFHFSLFSTALWDLVNSRPVHSLMSSHLFLCLPCFFPPFTVPCKVVLARPHERETKPYHCSLRLFTMVRRPSCTLIVCWILAWTSSFVTWSLYEMHSILW